MSDFAALDPLDEHNRKLQDQVHPQGYRNPQPKDRYNLVVVGAGTAGLVTAAIAAGTGAKVALVERALMGGDCLNVGCVPSKALLSAARAVAAVRQAGEFGIQVPAGVTVNFPAVMERMRRLRSEISPHDSVRRFTDLGIDVFLGQAEFQGVDRLNVEKQELRFAKAAICTGARAGTPPIPGLDQVQFLTNETLFSLTELPRRLAVIGAGPIGCEMAQAFARFGAEVYLIEASHGVLPREDRDAAEIVRQQLVKDGVKVLCCGKELKVSPADGNRVRLNVDSHGQACDVVVDKLLVAAGRRPNVEGLGLERAGVDYADKGIVINDRFRTTNLRIYAAGDVCSPYQFTHAADFMARAVVRNALFLGRLKHSQLIVPWCTYTSPELAQVGLTTEQARERGEAIDTFTQPLASVDRAILDGETEGFIRVHVRKGTDEIVGATIVASNAGDLIGEFSLAMTEGIGLGRIANAIHPYPTRAEAVRRTGDLYNKTRFTPLAQRLARHWLAWD